MRAISITNLFPLRPVLHTCSMLPSVGYSNLFVEDDFILGRYFVFGIKKNSVKIGGEHLCGVTQSYTHTGRPKCACRIYLAEGGGEGEDGRMGKRGSKGVGE